MTGDNETKLTTRQKTFLSRLTDVYREIQMPVHYSVIAHKLGLCASTAYDMLKVLEKKGMVISQYHMPRESAGPGRANIVFQPTTSTIEQFTPDEAEAGLHGEWKAAKARIMGSLEKNRKSAKGELVNGLFEQANRMNSPLARSAQILTALLVSLRESNHVAADEDIVGTMLKAAPSGPGMSSVAGFVLGLSLNDKRVRSNLRKHRGFIDKFITSVQNMNQDNLVKLREFMLDVWARLWPGTSLQY